MQRHTERKKIAMKAKFIGKYYGTGFDRNMVYLEYEYRGCRYTVYENRARGNEPLSWQHRAEQDRIDATIDTIPVKGESIDWDKELAEIFEMNGWNE